MAPANRESSMVWNPRTAPVEPDEGDAHRSLVRCAVLLDIGLAAACLVAFGIWDLVGSTRVMWAGLLGIAFGGTLACVLWVRAGSVLDRGERPVHGRSEHESVVEAVERRALTHPFAR